jgi:DNA (cytosine-5)-methyltransferase 1
MSAFLFGAFGAKTTIIGAGFLLDHCFFLSQGSCRVQTGMSLSCQDMCVSTHLPMRRRLRQWYFLLMSRPLAEAFPANHRPVAVDLFAGAGGLSLGLEQAGFDIAVAIERGLGPATTHRRNFASTPILIADIRAVTAQSVRSAITKGFAKRELSWNGEITICGGGPPCQGYSMGGHRRANDERNVLVHEFRRLVTALRSRYFVMENVPGLLQPTNSAILTELMKSFHRSGYTVAEPIIVDASRLGLPQSRRRVLLFGWRRGEAPVDVSGLEKLECERATVRDAIDDLPEIETVDALLETDRYSFGHGSSLPSPYAEHMRALSLGFAYPREWDGITLSGCARTRHCASVVRRFRRTEPGNTEPISRYRRLHPMGTAPTLRAGTGPEHGSHTPPRPIHYRTPRVISVREAARLQSFPDWFQFADAKWHAWQEIGNAVPPLLARVVGAALLKSANTFPR